VFKLRIAPGLKLQKTDLVTGYLLLSEEVLRMSNETGIALEKRSVSVGSPYFSELIDAAQATSRHEIDRLFNTLQARKDEWVRLEISERLSILDEIRKDLFKVKARWVRAELEAKGIPAQTLGEAEEWGHLATVFRAVREVQHSLVQIQKWGRPKIPGAITTRINEQVVVPVFPRSLFDRFLFFGVSGEVRMEPGVTVDEVIEAQAAAYRDSARQGKVACVLAGGNASLLPVSDLLDRLFVKLQVVAVKLNPVNAHMGPILEQGFRALIDRGFLRFVYGGAEEGSYLCSHLAVEELHLTGSDKTYETIVFGSGPEGKRRKAERNPLLSKRFTGELGNVSPVIVVPGPWDQGDVKEQAKHLATWLVVNAGFACFYPRVIVNHKSWALRYALIDEIGRLLDGVPTREAYYPGARDRYKEYIAAHPEALQFGTATGGHLPWTVIADVDPETANDICFKREAFCGLCAETAIEAPSVARFLDRAVKFVNETLWGTLTATLIVHPKSLENPEINAAVEHAISELRYGTVSVNMWPYYSAYFMTAPWGAFPGHDEYNIQSGTGKTFNVLMLERPQKSVVRAPFKRLDPFTVGSRRPIEFTKKVAQFEADPSWWKLPGLIFTVLRS